MRHADDCLHDEPGVTVCTCEPEAEDVCGETYDHDLREVDRRDGWVTYECRECGAELQEEEEP